MNPEDHLCGVCETNRANIESETEMDIGGNIILYFCRECCDAYETTGAKIEAYIRRQIESQRNLDG